MSWVTGRQPPEAQLSARRAARAGHGGDAPARDGRRTPDPCVALVGAPNVRKSALFNGCPLKGAARWSGARTVGLADLFRIGHAEFAVDEPLARHVRVHRFSRSA